MKRFWCMLGFHRWTKWEQFTLHVKVLPGRLAPQNLQGKILDTEEHWQGRHCVRCHRKQEERVR